MNNIANKISASAKRRQRYQRTAEAERPVALTPTKLRLLQYLSEMRFLSLPQLARLCGPYMRLDLAEKSTRRHMRVLFDAGLVDALPVSRAALALPGALNDASLLYGSAPNIYTSTKAGLGLLWRAGLIDDKEARRSAPTYGPKNGLFLAHELAVRDVRIWLEKAARAQEYEVEIWKDSEAAAIPLNGVQAPFWVRPDAWFVCRMGKTVLVCLVEVDRGTERGGRRWGEKLAAYAALFADRQQLTAFTGYVNARVIVVAPNEHRRDRLYNMVAEADGILATHFWFADHASLVDLDILLPCWRQSFSSGLRSLLPKAPDRTAITLQP